MHTQETVQGGIKMDSLMLGILPPTGALIHSRNIYQRKPGAVSSFAVRDYV